MTTNDTAKTGYTVIDGMVFPTADAAVVVASQTEIDADNAMIDDEEVAKND